MVQVFTQHTSKLSTVRRSRLNSRLKIAIAFSFTALLLLVLYECYQCSSSSLIALFSSKVYHLSKTVPDISNKSVNRRPDRCTPEACIPKNSGSDLDQLRVYKSQRAAGNYSGYWCGRAFSFGDKCNKAYAAEVASLRHNVTFKFLDCCLRIHIRESHAQIKSNRTLLAGGSNFYVLVENEGRRYLCDVEDHFNDSYTARCPYYGDCLNVTIFMISYQFTAFESKLPLCLKPLVWLGRNLCPDISMKKIIPETGYTGWYTKASWWTTQELEPPEDTWYWREPGRNLRQAAAEEDSLKRCVTTKMNSLTFIADSHLSFARDYLLQLAGLLTFNASTDVTFDYKKVPVKTGKVTNVPTGFTDDLLDYASRTFLPNDTEIRRTFRDVIVINSGFWDILNRNLESFETAGISRIIDALKIIRASPAWADATVVFLTIPPHRSQANHTVFRPANNVAMSVGNRMLLQRIREENLNVTIIDFFALIFAHYDSTADTHHYIRVTKEKLNAARGEIGKVVVRECFRQICDKL